MVATTSLHCLIWCSVAISALTLSFAMAECTNGVALRATCSGIPQMTSRTFLLCDTECRTDTETITCRENPTSWSLSEDGSQQNALTINTSAESYSVEGNVLHITFTIFTGRIGGLYRCIYGDGSTTDELCVYVYERSVFASCPHEFGGCTEEVPLSVMGGESIQFNATVIYTPGGSCDFVQPVTRIELVKIGEVFGVNNALLYACDTEEGAECLTNDNRLSLARGSRLGLQFVFALSNTVYSNDSGLYEVTVRGMNPADGSGTQLKKRFRLRVDPGPSTPPTMRKETDIVSTLSSAGQTVSIGAAPPSDPQTGVAVVVGVVLLLSMISILLLVILLIAYKRHCKHGEPNINSVTNKLATSQPGTEPAQGNYASPTPGHRTYLGSFIETIELPDTLGLNSQDKEVRLSSSVISNGGGIVVFNTAHSVRPPLIFEVEGLSNSNQQVAHV